MNFKKYLESVMKKLKWYDVKLAQLAAIFFILVLITAFPSFLALVLRLDWYWYLLATIICGIPIVKHMFF